MDNYNIINRQIEQVRFSLNETSDNIKSDKQILMAYGDLASFIAKIFEMPFEHDGYIRSNLKFDPYFNLTDTKPVRSFVSSNVENYNIELPLRGLEWYFKVDEPFNTDLENIEYVKYQIAKLQALIGDKKYNFQSLQS